ncbi:hypothetical protein C7M84_003587 [Penaeus vannamei]|uniref:Integrase catalytic domain-containing protein n=1 Tax=Penaeus vannamei TaxID=6689 RepID=A0A423TMR3_PENVA|nr:hypothetical protein C7M84_003587 [Penaeus vannamei]
MWMPQFQILDLVDAKYKLLENIVIVSTSKGAQLPVFNSIKRDPFYPGKDNNITSSSQHTAQITCSFDLYVYPFDVQMCSIRLRLPHSYVNNVYFDVNKGSAFFTGKQDLALYTISNVHYDSRSDKTNLAINFELCRRQGLVLMTTFIPSMLLLLVSWATLFIKQEALNVRAGMALTTLLILYTLFANFSRSIPQTDIVKLRKTLSQQERPQPPESKIGQEKNPTLTPPRSHEPTICGVRVPVTPTPRQQTAPPAEAKVPCQRLLNPPFSDLYSPSRLEEAYLYLTSNSPISQSANSTCLLPPPSAQHHIALPRTLKPAERSYHTTDRELLAITYALRHFRELILGYKIEVHTDHSALTTALHGRDPHGRRARAIEVLAEYDVTIVYLPGRQNVVADALSRAPLPSPAELQACSTNQPAPALRYDVPDFPFEKVSCDTLSGFVTTRSGNKHILVFVDNFTRYCELVPVPNKSAKVVAKAFHDFIQRYTTPTYFSCDNGTEFQNEVMDNLCKIMNVTRVNILPYRPQSNGITERLNGSILTFMRSLVDTTSDNWDDLLLTIQSAINSTFHSSLGDTPHFLLYGSDKRLPYDLFQTRRKPEYSDSYAEYL